MHDHHWSSQELVRSETLVTEEKLALEMYFDTKHLLTAEIEKLVREVLLQLQQRDIQVDEWLHLFGMIIAPLRQGQDNNSTGFSLSREEQPLSACFIHNQLCGIS